MAAAAIVTLRALTLVTAAGTAHMALPAVLDVSPLICLQVFCFFFFMKFVQDNVHGTSASTRTMPE